jgi:hypothetical protein
MRRMIDHWFTDFRELLDAIAGDNPIRECRICGCTDDNCLGCIAKTGSPCHWIEDDLCSACAGEVSGSKTVS